MDLQYINGSTERIYQNGSTIIGCSNEVVRFIPSVPQDQMLDPKSYRHHVFKDGQRIADIMNRAINIRLKRYAVTFYPSFPELPLIKPTSHNEDGNPFKTSVNDDSVGTLIPSLVSKLREEAFEILIAKDDVQVFEEVIDIASYLFSEVMEYEAVKTLVFTALTSVIAKQKSRQLQPAASRLFNSILFYLKGYVHDQMDS